MQKIKSALVSSSIALFLSVNLYAQESYTIENKTLKEALEIISKKSNLSYVSQDKLFENKRLNDIKNVEGLEKALTLLLKGTGLEAVVTSSTIVTRKKEVNKSDSNNLGNVDVIDTLYKKMANKNFSSEANLGLFGDSDIKDMPLSVLTFTKDSIKNNQARQLSDLITQDSSVRSSGAYGDNAESFYIRGVPLGDQNAGEFALDGIYGVSPNYKVFTDTIEAVSVVKGPGTVLFGMSPMGSVGGAINLVPKRAYKELSEVELRYMNKARPGAAVDISRRFGQDNEFGTRLNLGLDAGKTPIDNLESKTFSGSLSLDYIGKDFMTSLDVISQYEKLDAPFRRFKLGGGLTSLPDSPKNDFNLAQDWEFSETKENLALYKFDYFLGSNSQIGVYLGGANTGIERLFQNGSKLLNEKGDVQTRISAAEFDISRFSYGLKGQTIFEVGNIKHKLSLDLTSYKDTVKKSINYGYTNFMTNIYSPVKVQKQSYSLLTSPKKSSETTLRSLALSDTMSNINENIFVTLGARYQNIDIVNYNSDGTYRNSNDKAKVSPFLGIVGKINDNLSLYANYTEGLSSVGVAPSYASNSEEKLDPFKSTQVEVGAKYRVNNIDLGLAFFDLERRTGELDGTLLFTPTRKLQNRGIEVYGMGEIYEGLRFNTGVTYLNTKIKETKINYDNDNIGGAPKLLANVGFDIDIPFVEGLSLGNYFIYSSKQYVKDGSKIEVPAWTRWDMGLKYATKVKGNNLTVMLDVNNVTDKGYYEGTSQWGHISSGEPRVYSLSMNYKF